MRAEQLRALKSACLEFFRFAPARLSLIFLLMLSQGFTSGAGMMLIIPLLHLIGLDVGSNAGSEFSDIIGRFFSAIGIPLTLPAILIVYVVFVSLVALLRYVQTVLSTAVKQAYVCETRNQLYSALLHSRWQFIIRHKMTDFIHCLTGQVQAIGMASHDMLTLLSQVIMVAVYIGLSLLLSWKMTLLAAVFGLALLLLLLPFNRVVVRSGQKQLGGGKMIFQLFSEQLASLKMIKSYGSEARYLERVSAESRMLEDQQLHMTRINAITQLVSAVGTVVAFSVSFYFAFEWFSMSLATLLLLLLIFSRLMPQLTSLQSGYQRLLHRLPAFEDIRRMQRECREAVEADELTGIETPQLHERLSLEHVSFRYEGGNRQVIDNLSLTVEHNATIAITGPSGAGKSTLADLIAGLLVPDSGSIRCDGVALEGERRLAWRRGVAYITQEVFLFHDSVRANLQWVAPEAAEDELWQALEVAAAADFVRALPDGIDTVIGDRGIRLSGGERQRLALARALLSKPQLLILDEATSALDHDNEQKIHQALLQLDGKLTILIIAHRETTIAHVKQRIVLGGGTEPR